MKSMPSFRPLLSLFLFLIILSAACVPVRKQTYLQERSPELKDYPKDTIMKSFQLGGYQYALQPGDILSVRINSLTDDRYDFFSRAGSTGGGGEDPLLSGFLIEPDGNIQLPVIGNLYLQGLTLQEARLKINQAVDGYLKSPTVHVKLLNFKYTILGEVGSEGTFTTFDPQFSIMEAIGNAGGLDEFADRANIKLVRRNGSQVDVVFIDLLDDDLIASPYYYLKPNDLIVVRPLQAKTFNSFTARNITLGISILSTITLLYLRFSM